MVSGPQRAVSMIKLASGRPKMVNVCDVSSTQSESEKTVKVTVYETSLDD